MDLGGIPPRHFARKRNGCVAAVSANQPLADWRHSTALFGFRLKACLIADLFDSANSRFKSKQ